MLSLRYTLTSAARSLEIINISRKLDCFVVCSVRGPRPRYPRVWKSNKRIGTISKSEKLVECIKGLSNVKEEVYGALDSFIAWELEFPLIVVKKALKFLESEKEWKRIIQVTKWMLSKGQGKTMGSYYTLLNALAEDERLEEAEELWMKIFSENLESLPRVFFDKMISIYHRNGMHEKMFEVFADMEELGVRPSSSIVTKLGNVFQKLDMLEKYEKLLKKYPPRTWEYRYIKGKRVKIRLKNLRGSDQKVDETYDSWDDGGTEDSTDDTSVSREARGTDNSTDDNTVSWEAGSTEDTTDDISVSRKAECTENSTDDTIVSWEARGTEDSTELMV
eukprot:TRINITY_DN20489_c0_g1_i1.p1 TRINITY_DN20489_c0_g1~~TRINITY_DN20489_c0_g1_i1.p1  ORF type:complete len:334 (+),score=66.11 TRINITY_DN20489_c0_g1_i1:224-1225(+)